MTPADLTPRPTGRKRSAARLAAVQALYQLEMSGATPSLGEVDRVIRDFVKNRLGLDVEGAGYAEVDQRLFADIVKGAMLRLSDLDGMLRSTLADEWPFDRLEAILRAVLRAGTYEMLERRDIPARVVISEYLDVTHAFFGGKEPGLVNSVLDRLARVLRTESDLADGGGDGRPG
jgi:N utilization substance protein B